MCRVQQAEQTAVEKARFRAVQTVQCVCLAEGVETVLVKAIAVHVAKWVNLPPSRARVNRQRFSHATTNLVTASRGRFNRAKESSAIVNLAPLSLVGISPVRVSREPSNLEMSNRVRASHEASNRVTVSRVNLSHVIFSHRAETRDREIRSPEANSHEVNRDASVPAGRLSPMKPRP